MLNASLNGQGTVSFWLGGGEYIVHPVHPLAKPLDSITMVFFLPHPVPSQSANKPIKPELPVINIDFDIKVPVHCGGHASHVPRPPVQNSGLVVAEVAVVETEWELVGTGISPLGLVA